MKIIILQDYLRSGGTERQSVMMARYFRSVGHDALLITFRPGGALQPSLIDVPHRALQKFDTGLDWYAPGLRKAVEQFQPDVVLCMGRIANCYGWFVQRWLWRNLAGGVVIATMRTGKSLPWLFRRTLEVASHVIANSDDSRRVLINDYRVPDRKISVIRNAMVFPPQSETGPERFSDRFQMARRQFGARTQCVVMLWVGMFRPEKNQRAIIEIVSRFPVELYWELWFVGEGPERAACEELVQKLGLEEQVRFWGFRDDPTPFYHAADVAVLTSRSESLSNFLIEAHAHGIPSVAYGVTGVVECGGTVVPPENPEAFTQALMPYLRDAEYRRSQGDRVAVYAREHFSPASQGNAYIELFKRLLELQPLR